MRAPLLIASTKGAKKISNAIAISSWTIEKRRSLNRCRVAFTDSFACAVSLIQFQKFVTSLRVFSFSGAVSERA